MQNVLSVVAERTPRPLYTQRVQSFQLSRSSDPIPHCPIAYPYFPNIFKIKSRNTPRNENVINRHRTITGSGLRMYVHQTTKISKIFMNEANDADHDQILIKPTNRGAILDRRVGVIRFGVFVGMVVLDCGKNQTFFFPIVRCRKKIGCQQDCVKNSKRIFDASPRAHNVLKRWSKLYDSMGCIQFVLSSPAPTRSEFHQFDPFPPKKNGVYLG